MTNKACALPMRCLRADRLNRTSTGILCRTQISVSMTDVHRPQPPAQATNVSEAGALHRGSIAGPKSCVAVCTGPGVQPLSSLNSILVHRTPLGSGHPTVPLRSGRRGPRFKSGQPGLPFSPAPAAGAPSTLVESASRRHGCARWGGAGQHMLSAAWLLVDPSPGAGSTPMARRLLPVSRAGSRIPCRDHEDATCAQPLSGPCKTGSKHHSGWSCSTRWSR